MKTMLFALIALFAMTDGARAEDLITTSLIDNVTTTTQFESGKTKLALMSSVVQIGKLGGKSLFDLQAGFNTNVKPQPDEPRSASVVFGGWAKIDPIISRYVKFPEEWEFLKSLEHGPALNYDVRNDEWRVSYQAGLAFDLNPK